MSRAKKPAHTHDGGAASYDKSEVEDKMRQFDVLQYELLNKKRFQNSLDRMTSICGGQCFFPIDTAEVSEQLSTSELNCFLNCSQSLLYMAKDRERIFQFGKR